MGSEDRKHDNTTPALARKHGVRKFVSSRWTLAALSLCLTATMALGYVFVARPAHAASLTPCTRVSIGATCYNSINDAIAAASPGATITVKAGTYDANTESGATNKDTQVIINKPINLVGAGAGSTIIRGLPANGSSISGVINIPSTFTPAGNVTISGFTIEGAILNDSNDDGILEVVQDTHSSDTITIKNNVFTDNSHDQPRHAVGIRLIHWLSRPTRR